MNFTVRTFALLILLATRSVAPAALTALATTPAPAPASRPVDPLVLAQASMDLDTVETLLADKDREGAIRRFTRIAGEASNDPAFAGRAMIARAQVNDAADALLREVDDIVGAKQYAAAAQRLHELLGVMAGLPTGSLARQHLAQLVSRPEVQHEIELAEQREKGHAALDAARKLRDAGPAEDAYAAFKNVAIDFKTTPAAQAAEDAVKAYESDPAFRIRLRDRAAAPKAKAALNLAENYLAAGKTKLARRKYEEVVKNFPDTTFAQIAKEALEQLK